MAPHKPIKHGTKRWHIAEACGLDIPWDECFRIYKPKVLAQERPWIFSANVNGKRIPKSLPNQLIDLKNEVRRVYALMGRLEDENAYVDTSASEEAIEEAAKAVLDALSKSEDEEAEEIAAEEEEKPKPAPKASKKQKLASEKEFFFSEWKRLRKWIADRAASIGGQPIDSLDTMRPVIAARAAIEQGISARTLLYAMVCHWPEDTRASADVQKVDFRDESPVVEHPGIPWIHHLTGYALQLVKAHIPVMLIGPAGTGKSHICRQVATILDLPYGECPLTAGATPSWLLGRHTVTGFIPSQFLEIYSGGGVFNFEEIDAADSNMLIVVNNALAADSFHNPVNGEVYVKSENFLPMATANTFGLGANSSYTGRERLDLATIDRFRMGRILLDLDENLAGNLMFA